MMQDMMPSKKQFKKLKPPKKSNDLVDVSDNDDESCSEGSNESDNDFLFEDKQNDFPFEEKEIESTSLSLGEFPEIAGPQWEEIKELKPSRWLKGYKVLSGPQNTEKTSQSPPSEFFS